MYDGLVGVCVCVGVGVVGSQHMYVYIYCDSLHTCPGSGSYMLFLRLPHVVHRTRAQCGGSGPAQNQFLHHHLCLPTTALPLAQWAESAMCSALRENW